MISPVQKFFGFLEDPFNLTPDPRFLFLAIGHHETLSSMISGIKERKGITIISGEVGTGKTTLVYALLNELSEKIKTAFVFYTKMSFEDLLKYILEDLEVSVPNENLTTLLALFRQYLKERLIRDETVAIVIDEAQHLEFEVIENLFRLCCEESSVAKLVQILLIGQPELETKLDSQKMQPFKNRIAIRNYLRPLNQKESEEYIDHRLKAVGSSSSKVFTPQANFTAENIP
jgi:general secretion pathway protein A